MPIAVKDKWQCPFAIYSYLIAVAAVLLRLASKRNFTFNPAFILTLLSLAQNPEYVTDS